jgi:ketosteroid isomerase-like protein
MGSADRIELAKSAYRAWAEADREAIEALLADDFTFHAPPDPNLDRDGFFEVCWPHAGNRHGDFEFARLVESGDEVIVTYIATRKDGARFRNTEVLRFEGDRIVEQEVYFGWDL